MNVSDWEHKENRKLAETLRQQGYQINANGDGYSVHLGSLFIGGASVMLPRKKPLHYKHRDANIRDFFKTAVQIAYRHQQSLTHI